MENETQDSFSISEFVYLDAKIDQFDNSFKLLSTISSANFDGVIPENIIFYPNASTYDLVAGRYILLDDTFCLITTIYDNIDPVTTDTVSYEIFYAQSDGIETSKIIDVGGNTFTDGTELTVKHDDWDNKVLGESGWSLTTEGNSIFSNVAVRGRLEATEGYFDGFLVVGDPNDPISPGAMKIGTGVNSTNDGIFINANNYWYDTGLFAIGNGTAGVVWNGSTLAVTGQITATSGTIGGFTIGASSLFGGSGSNFVGIIPASLPFFAGATANDGTGAVFKVTNSGELTATNANITGNINATSGTFSGTISIGAGNSIFKADSNGIYLGNATFASAPFRVTPAGSLSATSGTIGGWSLSATELFSGSGSSRVSFNSSTGLIAIGPGNHGSIDTGFYADKDGKFSLSNQLIFTPVVSAGRANVSTTGTFTTGSPTTITVASATGIGKGMTVIGIGIDTGTTVTNVVGTTITISKNVLSNQAGISLSFILDDMSELSVTGRIKGVIESVTPITSPRLSTTITNANITGTSPSQTATFTTNGHSFLPNEKIFVEGLPVTNGLNNLNNREYVILTVPDSITLTISISGVTGVTTSTNSGLSATASLRELTMGLHPAEGVDGTDSWYHSAGTGIRLDKFNWWLTNNQFRVGSIGSYFEWDGTEFTIQGSGTKTLKFNVGSLDADNVISIADIGTTPTHNTTTTQFFVNGAGNFSLGQKLVWTASTSTLAIDGTVIIGGTAGSTIVSGAASGASSLQPGTAATDVNNNITTISGSKIRTGVIESTGYAYTSGNFSTIGTQLDLTNGLLRSKNFAITSDGSAFFKGDITGASGTFSGALNGGTISIGSGDSIFKADANGIYLGNAIFANAEFSVSPTGAFNAGSPNSTGFGSRLTNFLSNYSTSSPATIPFDDGTIQLWSSKFSAVINEFNTAGITARSQFYNAILGVTDTYSGYINLDWDRRDTWRIGPALYVPGTIQSGGNITVNGTVVSLTGHSHSGTYTTTNTKRGRQAVSFTSDAGQVTTITHNLNDSACTIVATAEQDAGTDYDLVVTLRTRAANTCTVEIFSRTGSAFTDTVYLNWIASTI